MPFATKDSGLKSACESQENVGYSLKNPFWWCLKDHLNRRTFPSCGTGAEKTSYTPCGTPLMKNDASWLGALLCLFSSRYLQWGHSKAQGCFSGRTFGYNRSIELGPTSQWHISSVATARYLMLYYYCFLYFFIVVQVQLTTFPPYHFPTPQPPHLPPSILPPLVLSMCPLYMFLKPLPLFLPLSPPTSPLVTVSLFLISLSLVTLMLFYVTGLVRTKGTFRHCVMTL